MVMCERRNQLTATLEGSPLEQIRLLTQNMLDERNKMAFKLIEQARKEEEVPRQITELMKNLIIMDERGAPEFGFPDTELLLNLIRKTGSP